MLIRFLSPHHIQFHRITLNALGALQTGPMAGFLFLRFSVRGPTKFPIIKSFGGQRLSEWRGYPYATPRLCTRYQNP